MNMRHNTRLAVTLVLLTVLSACAKITPETPKAAAAITADAVVVRVNELQAVVIDYCGLAPDGLCLPGTIQTSTAREVIKGCIDLRTVLKAVPAGWQATAKASWAQLKLRLAGVSNQGVIAAMAALDVLIGGL